MSEADAGTIVVKIGGEVVGSGEAAVLAADLRELVAGGARVAIVHGGGPQATELQKKLGLPTKQVAGRRVTDADTLDVMKMVIAGKLNVDLCAILGAAGLSPVGLHGASAQVVQAVRRPPKVYPSAGPDPVDMGLVVDKVGTSSVVYRIGLFQGDPEGAGAEAAAEGRFVHVYVDNTAEPGSGRPVSPIPEQIRAAVIPLLKG